MAVTLVGETSAVGFGTLVVSYASTAGNTLVLFGASNNTTGLSVTDSAGNTWTLAHDNASEGGTAQKHVLAYVCTNAAAVTSVTWNSGSGSNTAYVLAEFSPSTLTSSAGTVGTTAPTVTGDLAVIAAGQYKGANYTESTGWTELAYATANGGNGGYVLNAAYGGTGAPWTSIPTCGFVGVGLTAAATSHTYIAAGTAAARSGLSGTATAHLGVTGTVTARSDVAGAAVRVSRTFAASASASALTYVTGTATRVTRTYQAAGAAAATAHTTGAATVIAGPKSYPAGGTIAARTTTVGSAGIVNGAQTYPAHGIVAATTGTATTRPALRAAASGVTVGITRTAGAVILAARFGGVARATSATAGSVTLILQAHGITAATAHPIGYVTLDGQAAGRIATISAVAGAVTIYGTNRDLTITVTLAPSRLAAALADDDRLTISPTPDRLAATLAADRLNTTLAPDRMEATL